MRHILLPSALLIAFSAFAQQNHNDDCANAVVIPVSSTNTPVEWTLAHMYDAALAITPGSCSGNGYRDVWFRFTATATTHHIVYEGPGQSLARVEVLSGTCGSLSNLGCATNSDFLTVTGLSVGSDYYLRTYGNTNSFWLEAYVNVAVVSTPPNDECSGAIPLPIETPGASLFPSNAGSTVGATQSSLGCWTPAQNDSDDDVWFSFTASGTAHSIVLDPPNGLSLHVVSGTCASPTNVLCKQTTTGKEVLTGLTVGQTYRFRVYSTGSSATVRKRFRVSVYAMAANDECAGAIPIQVSAADDAPAPILLPVVAASESSQPGGCTPTLHDVWYSFVAPSTSVYFRDETGNAYFALYDGSCGALSCIFSADQSPAVATNLVPGNTYYLAAGDDNAPSNTRMYVREIAGNDECADAITLPVQAGPTPANWTYCDTHYATLSQAACTGAANQADDDVWYAFTATATTHTLHMFEISDSGNLRMELLSGACGSLTSVQCSGAVGSTIMSGLTVGTTYRLRVYDSSQSLAARLVVRLAITGPQVNEDCLGAIPLVSGSLLDYASTEKVITEPGSSSVSACSGNADDDVWYTFTATGRSAAFVAHPEGTTTFTAELFSGGCGALTSIDCRSNLAAGAFRIQYENLTPGVQYHIRVHTTNTVSGTFVPLFFGPPANDEITGAVQLPANASTFASPIAQYWTYGASQSYGRMCGSVGTPDDDVWFRFIATTNSHTIHAARYNSEFLEDQPQGSMRIEAYAGFSTDSVTLDVNVLGCGANTLALNTLAVGDTVYFRVFSEVGSFNSIFAISPYVTGGDNDNAPGALAMDFTNNWSAVFNTNGASQSQAGANCTITDFADDDIWFKFVATNSPGRIIVGFATKDLTLELFSGAPGNLTSVACSDNILVLPSGLVSGQTYYFRLYSWGNATPVSGRIGLWSDPSLTANDCVDETCLGPVLLTNPGLEQGDLCAPVFTHSGGSSYGTPVAPGWWHVGTGTADSFSSCATHDASEENPAIGIGAVSDREIPSRRGTGMGGMYVYYTGSDYREYLQARLTSPLIPGEPYLVSFSVASHLNQRRTDALGALLTTDPVNQPGQATLEMTPQIMAPDPVGGESWTTICGLIVPDEPLEYITIGSFLTNAQSWTSGSGNLSYFFIDDVVVALVTDPGCVTGLGVDDERPGDGVPASGDALFVFPNPAHDKLNIRIDDTLAGERAVVELFDATGRRVFGEQVMLGSMNLEVEVPGSLNSGIYQLILRVDGRMPRYSRVYLER